jgi:hypothetical protein
MGSRGFTIETLIETHLPDGQLQQIMEIIENRIALFRELAGTPDFKKLFIGEYEKHKVEHSITHAVQGGFPSGSSVVSGFSIESLQYPQGQVKPELSNATTILHIDNAQSDANAGYLRSYYEMNESKGDKSFFRIIYKVKERQCVRIRLEYRRISLPSLEKYLSF